MIRINRKFSPCSWHAAAILLVWTLPLFHVAASFGQGGVGTIVGTAKDSSGAVIPNATVTITNTATNILQKTKTNSAGDYAVGFLKPGTYNVTVEAPGFSKAAVDSIGLQIDQIARADVALKA